MNYKYTGNLETVFVYCKQSKSGWQQMLESTCNQGHISASVWFLYYQPKTIPLFLRKTNLPCCHGYCKVERSVVLACERLAADLVIPKVGIHSLVPIPHPAVWCRNAWANFISLKQPMKFQTSIRIVNKYFSRSKSCY